MSDNQNKTIRCQRCGKVLAEMRGAYSIEVRCPDCWRVTRERDRKAVDIKPQPVVCNR
jgi:phage FluMu protein Com